MGSVFLDAEGLENCQLDELRRVCGGLKMYQWTASNEISSRIAGAELVILNKARITREILVANPTLRLICVVATGTDCVDLQAARELGVTVCNCQAYGTDSVVQHVFTSILALHTSLLRYHGAVRAGRWQKAGQFCFLDFPITELKGKTLGIVGFGNLGKGVAAIAEAFGMRVVVAARPGSTDDTRPSLVEILPLVDVLTLHCPLNEHTRGLIGIKELAMMKPTAFLVNAARGGIVDEDALVEALKNGTIGGAAVDVLTVEPPKDGNPLLDTELPNLIVTPHVAWASEEARQRLVDHTVENITAWRAGTGVRVVNN
ncbi:NAD(P)-dependent oxidoreductase [Desulfopila aestuarii]|uniref:Glycerate dehydrogenase n=1 Tax=Desulfopila aestuarii DSM 18488 TaxID=1121416 RepID=A0A1M7YGF3_9BACT|nr:NAD(P)-dependent oxidoreductase [Desulfopila aestuarii]SHO51666.1 glycerate dehydrogenase [Desulfopila aestuarii DSM 18488]